MSDFLPEIPLWGHVWVIGFCSENAGNCVCVGMLGTGVLEQRSGVSSLAHPASFFFFRISWDKFVQLWAFWPIANHKHKILHAFPTLVSNSVLKSKCLHFLGVPLIKQNHSFHSLFPYQINGKQTLESQNVIKHQRYII